jgi:hypothetical protein
LFFSPAQLCSAQFRSPIPFSQYSLVFLSFNDLLLFLECKRGPLLLFGLAFSILWFSFCPAPLSYHIISYPFFFAVTSFRRQSHVSRQCNEESCLAFAAVLYILFLLCSAPLCYPLSTGRICIKGSQAFAFPALLCPTLPYLIFLSPAYHSDPPFITPTLLTTTTIMTTTRDH